MSEMGLLVQVVPNELVAINCCRHADLVSGSNLVIQTDHVAAAAQLHALLFANAFLQRDEEFDRSAWLDGAVHDKVGALRAEVARTAAQLHFVPPDANHIATEGEEIPMRSPAVFVLCRCHLTPIPDSIEVFGNTKLPYWRCIAPL